MVVLWLAVVVVVEWSIRYSKKKKSEVEWKVSAELMNSSLANRVGARLEHVSKVDEGGICGGGGGGGGDCVGG